MSTRPTTDRVREALFSILGDISDFSVLDCYAGTGALGIEALSRGARRAVFVESGREACDVIADNLRQLELTDRAVVLRLQVEKAGRSLAAQDPVDLLLADSPWPIAQAAAETVLRVAGGCVRENGRVVLGHPRKLDLKVPPDLGFTPQTTRQWGDSALTFCSRSQGPE